MLGRGGSRLVVWPAYRLIYLRLPKCANMPFAEFADIACALPDAETEKHLKSQSFFLYCGTERLPRFIGRLENAAADWRELARQAGFRSALPHLNPTGGVDLADYYADAALVNRVGDRYRNDVENFGYDSPRIGAATLGA